MANHANQNPGNPPVNPLPTNPAANPPPPVANQPVVNQGQINTGARVATARRPIEKKWLYAFIVVPVILSAVGGLLYFKNSKKVAEDNDIHPKTIQPSRKFVLRAAVDGKPLLSVDMVVEKPEVEKAGKETEEVPASMPPKVGQKSVSDLEKENSIAFKKHFEDLLSGSMPLKDLNEKFEKHITDDKAFQKKTDGRLDNIEKGIEKIADTMGGVKKTLPSSATGDAEKDNDEKNK